MNDERGVARQGREEGPDMSYLTHASGSEAPAVLSTSARDMPDANAAPFSTAREGVLEAPRLRESELDRAVDESGVVCQTHIGGQALLEGVMMRGRYNWAIAVREPSGFLYTEEHDLPYGRGEGSWMRKPVLRGCTALVESLALGYRALDIAAQHAFADENVASEEDLPAQKNASAEEDLLADKTVPAEVSAPLDKTAPEGENAPLDKTASTADAIPKPLMTVSMILGILLGVGIFIVLPALITNLLVGDYGERTLLWNLVDGVLRVVIFIFYIWLIGRMPDIRRMFAYHGAEHKTIHCYEHGLPLNVRNARRFPALHVRCGTAFMLTTMVIAILVFTLVPVNLLVNALGIHDGAARLAAVILTRIILLPLVAGLSYEVTVKWAGSRPGNPLVRVILWPGLQLQRLTTNEPDDGMLEAAIAAMQRVLSREQREQARALDEGALTSDSKRAAA